MRYIIYEGRGDINMLGKIIFDTEDLKIIREDK
jgi:hypothetical protein